MDQPEGISLIGRRGFATACQASPVIGRCILGFDLRGDFSRGYGLLVCEGGLCHMQRQQQSLGSALPHHRLVVCRKSLELLAAVRAAQVRDAKLRDEALRAAKGTCLNIAEGAGRVTHADKAWVVLRPLLGVAYAIARGECVECVAAVEITAAAGDARSDAIAAALSCGNEVFSMLGALIG
jgi:hypothetical protein